MFTTSVTQSKNLTSVILSKSRMPTRTEYVHSSLRNRRFQTFLDLVYFGNDVKIAKPFFYLNMLNFSRMLRNRFCVFNLHGISGTSCCVIHSNNMKKITDDKTKQLNKQTNKQTKKPLYKLQNSI